MLTLLRALPDRLDAADLKAVAWADLPAQAEAHGLSGLLLNALARREAEVPRAALAALRAQARNAAAWALKLRRLQTDALAALAKEGLTPVLLKGQGFAARYWGDPLLRPASDVDVMVRTEELPQARRAMAALGLKEHVDEGEDDPFAHHHHLGFHGPAGLVEVHFRLLTGPGGGQLGDEAVWARSRPGTADGAAVRWLSPEDELVYLASHAAGHLFLRLAWLVDLKLLLAKERALDWDAAVALAARAELKAATHAALVLAKEALGAEVPEQALRALAPSPLHARLVKKAFTPERLLAATLAQGPSASALRALLADTPRRAASHLAQGVARRVKREVRSRRKHR